mmetsp:Transcript_37999/g.108499  ORF Transcript_37999/g.108499 Transcript_37999/m.108499 type:complete len:327 (-) Transcript_37999:497-1477(-)
MRHQLFEHFDEAQCLLPVVFAGGAAAPLGGLVRPALRITRRLHHRHKRNRLHIVGPWESPGCGSLLRFGYGDESVVVELKGWEHGDGGVHAVLGRQHHRNHTRQHQTGKQRQIQTLSLSLVADDGCGQLVLVADENELLAALDHRHRRRRLRHLGRLVYQHCRELDWHPLCVPFGHLGGGCQAWLTRTDGRSDDHIGFGDDVVYRPLLSHLDVLLCQAQQTVRLVQLGLAGSLVLVTGVVLVGPVELLPPLPGLPLMRQRSTVLWVLVDHSVHSVVLECGVDHERTARADRLDAHLNEALQQVVSSHVREGSGKHLLDPRRGPRGT